MISTKKKGRPKNFNREEALKSALNVFWRKGYDGASMKDLTSAMGINGPSLYSTFGDKNALYIQTIEAYTLNNACAPLIAFETEPDINLAVKKFFCEVIEHAVENDSGAKGCFLSSCVATSSGEVEGVQAILNTTIADVDKRLALRFDLEISKGTLAKDFPSLEKARLMFDLRQGYVFRARAGVQLETIKKDVKKRVKMILRHP